MQLFCFDYFVVYFNEIFKVDIEYENVLFVFVEVRFLFFKLMVGMMCEFFLLLFCNEVVIFFLQWIYGMKYDVLGEFGIFLVLIVCDCEGFIYQVVFN